MTIVAKNPQHVEEIKALISSGDISLDTYKLAFQKKHGRPTTLSHDDLINLLANDSEGDLADNMDLWVPHMLKNEANATAA